MTGSVVVPRTAPRVPIRTVVTTAALGTVLTVPSVAGAGRAGLVGPFAWGAYGLAADVVLLATQRPSTAPLSP